MATRESYVHANGLRFHVLEYGDASEPVLVFLHGVLASAQTYDGLLEHLGTGRRLVAIDQRGHGCTQHVSDYSWPRWVEDLAALCEKLELTSFDLVGHSMGAHNALRFTGTHPEMIEHLVLIDGGFGPANSPGEGKYWNLVVSLFPPDGYVSLDAYTANVLHAFPRADQDLVESSAAHLAQRSDGSWAWPDGADLAVLAADPAEPTPVELLALQAAVTCPVLVVRAQFSELFVGDNYIRLAEQLDDGIAAELPGSGHMIQWENVPGLTQMVDDFLQPI